MNPKTDSETLIYLKKIAKSVYLYVLWLFVFMLIGFYFNLFATSEGTPLVFVILYYALAVLSFAWMTRFVIKMWK